MLAERRKIRPFKRHGSRAIVRPARTRATTDHRGNLTEAAAFERSRSIPIAAAHQIESADRPHVKGGTFRERRRTRTVRNPAREKTRTDMIRRMSEEAEISLANIKRRVEARAGG